MRPTASCFLQTHLADDMEKLRLELDQFRLRAGSLTDPTLSRCAPCVCLLLKTSHRLYHIGI